MDDLMGTVREKFLQRQREIENRGNEDTEYDEDEEDDDDDITWTDSHTNEMMDLMTTALEKTKEKMENEITLDGIEEDTLDEDEDDISFELPGSETFNVVQEINTVMQVITEVSQDVPSLQEELGAPPPTLEDDGAVGVALPTHQERKKWSGLVRRLSMRRRSSSFMRRDSFPTLPQFQNKTRRGSLFCTEPEPESETEDEDSEGSVCDGGKENFNNLCVEEESEQEWE